MPPSAPLPEPRRDAQGQRIYLLEKTEFDVTFDAWQGRVAEALEGSPWALVGIKRRGAVLARRPTTP